MLVALMVRESPGRKLMRNLIYAGVGSRNTPADEGGNMIEWVQQRITTLNQNEVFVFGSNGSGFHGAGAAGLAFRGDSRNNWRQDAWFCRVVQEGKRVPGRWAEYGVARGYQCGTHGDSYAIQTVTRPGARQSVTRRDIYAQLIELWAWLEANDRHALITPLGEGYAGWSREEMAEVWDFLILKHGPRNATWVRC